MKDERDGGIIKHMQIICVERVDADVPADMKETIAQAAKYLLMEKGVKKLTVKDIVEECRITRQTFYYHFEDIPALFRWIFERDTARNLLEVKALESGEAQLRCLFVMAIHALPYVKKGIESNYRDELERFLSQYIQRLFEQLCDEENLYRNCSRSEVKLILRYHSQAILGMLRSWTEADTNNLDQIVHIVFRLMTEGIPPLE